LAVNRHQAIGGVVLASAELKVLVDESEEFEFKSSRQVDLKEISETQEIFEVAW
jgi:CRISPR/Cas system Type II protein with McrA/HNH and RuvC-like nuclease domain